MPESRSTAASIAHPDPSHEATYAGLERHAGRALLAGAMVVGNLLLLQVVRHAGGDTVLHSALELGLVLAMFLLLYRLAGRTVRFAVGSARHQARLSSAMMQAVERFADEPAGASGTVEALSAAARDAGCEVLVWHEGERCLLQPELGERLPLRPAMTRRLLEAMSLRKVMTVTDTSVLAWLPAELSRRDGTSSLLIAPMWAGPHFVGLVLRRYASPHMLLRSQQESALVSALAALGAVAIDKALTVDREQQRAEDTALLLRSVEVASESVSRDQVGDYAAQACQALRGQRCAIYSIASGQLRVVGTHGIPTALAPAGRLPMRSRFVSRMHHAPARAERIRLDQLDDAAARSLRMLGFCSEVVVQPVRDDAGMLGLIVVDGCAGELARRETDLLAALARQVSMSLERKRMWRAIRKRSRHLACTPKLARRLTGQRDAAAVARIAVRELSSGFGFGRVSIALRRDGGEGLRIAASAGMPAQAHSAVLTTPALNEAYSSGLPYVSCVGDAACDEEGSAASVRIDDPDAPVGCRSRIVVPIPGGSDGELCGVIAVYECDPDALGEDDLHMLETIADTLGGTLEQAALFETLERSYFKTVEALSAALEAKDAYTLDHARSITETSAAVGRRLGMREDEIRDLRLGALLHDIGKIGVPGEILNKPGPLDDAEFEVMKEHTLIGEQIIAPIEFLDGVRPLVLHEHERWDGKGYPHGLQGPEIPLGARIIFVCDAYHAMTSDRPYRTALPEEEARERLRAGAGSQFDPRVVDAFMQVLENEEADAEPVGNELLAQPAVLEPGAARMKWFGTGGRAPAAERQQPASGDELLV